MSNGAPDQQTVAAANFQYEIYARGLAGETPSLPVAVSELQERAREVLSAEAFGYVAGGAGAERTMAANLLAFDHWQIVPRMLRDISTRDLSTTVLGTSMPAPLLLAPVGVQSIVHPEGELAVGRAAAAHELPFILSTASSHAIEDVADAVGAARRWYQLYWPRDRELAASFVARAQRAGYSALVVTLDTWLLGWRPRDLQNAYLPFLKGEGVANYFSDPVFRSALGAHAGGRPRAGDRTLGLSVLQSGRYLGGPALAARADRASDRAQGRAPCGRRPPRAPTRRAGADRVKPRRAPGRRCDRRAGRAAAVCEAVGDRMEILFDSGIRTGSDIFKALALGASAVCLGRPYMWGLALDGQAGVQQVLRCLLAELDLTLALSGCTTIAEIDRMALADASQLTNHSDERERRVGHLAWPGRRERVRTPPAI